MMDEISTLLESPERYKQMESALQRHCVPDCAERLCDIIYRLATKQKEK